jgi:tripartite-type tricarboxylate transporter receptor subunit TctC
MAAVMANEVQLYLGGLGAGRGLLKGGKLKAIAIGSRERLPAAPEIPTVIESGFKDFVAGNWFALAAPAGTDAPIVERWALEVRRAIQTPEIQKRLIDLGIVSMGSTPSEMARQLVQEAALWQKVVKTSGIKAD